MLQAFHERVFSLKNVLMLMAIIESCFAIESQSNSVPTLPPPIVYTIAGSDSGGGAGIQADLHAMQSMGCHGCSAVTCLTAQSSVGVDAIHAPPGTFLRDQLRTLLEDLPPRAVKVGMLGTAELAEEVGRFLRKITTTADGSFEPPLVVVDPVMVATSGAKLIDDDAHRAMVEHVFPYADVLTPNKHEAEALLGKKLLTAKDVEDGAKEILAMGSKSVLIKGGHSLSEAEADGKSNRTCQASTDYAQDYFLYAEQDETEIERLCDGAAGVWLRSVRYDTVHTHGTGCALSSAIASALAIGHQKREMARRADVNSISTGAEIAMDAVSACVLGKAYVTAGIDKGTQLGQGPGPVAHTEFPSSYEYFPTILSRSSSHTTPEMMPTFLRMKSSMKSQNNDDETTATLGTILPIVDTVEWVELLSRTDGITDVQLRIKDKTLRKSQILEMIKRAQEACEKTGVRLWINDHWDMAIAAQCFGVHVGQEDLKTCVDRGGLRQISEAGLALGISTHSYAELSVALAVRPTYISLGPVFGTTSKDVAFASQGLNTVTKWRQLIPPSIPLVAIGGIGDGVTAERVKEAGADNVAVIGAITKADDVSTAVMELLKAMSV